MISSTNHYLGAYDALERIFEPHSEMIWALESSVGMRDFLAAAKQHEEVIRGARCVLDNLNHRIAKGSIPDLAVESEHLQQLAESVQERFRLPVSSEITNLTAQFEQFGAPCAIAHFRAQESAVRRAMDSMSSPWLDVADGIRSASAFIELQRIGCALRSMPAFDTRLSEMLRANLGDWRERINWPNFVLADSLARTDFYGSRGLDLTLTSFPATAFDECLRFAGIKGEPPPLLDTYGGQVRYETDEKEEEFVRTNQAHDRLQRFETQLRGFIDQAMTAAFGDNWFKLQVPGEIYKKWVEKRQKAKKSGELGWPLIAYADFGDYVQIITRQDNWKAVFAPIFRRQMLVQESFNRLYPIRVCTMHARLITQDDELYLYVETKRILEAIGVNDTEGCPPVWRAKLS